MEQMWVSPVFVGRRPETEFLTGALARARAGEPQAVLIGGEAGIGKTRLVEEFLRTAEREGAVTAVGGCPEVGAEGLPYGPLATALRRLHRGLGAEFERAAAGMEGYLARLLPEFGEAQAEPNDVFGRARLFDHAARLFERLSAEHTVVLVVEDLHWSDRSTRELLGYLIRTLHSSPVLVVATYRSDDLHRRHPLRPYLAELDRLRSVQRIELERLGRTEVAAQLAGILGAGADRELVDRIDRRAEGNPFFVEELATAQRQGCIVGIPDSLRDILLVRVETLPDDTQRVLRTAAEGGSYVEHDLLAAVLDEREDRPGHPPGDDEVLIEALRTAVGAGILRPDSDGDGYCFHHALVREALSDDLLPGERHRINRRYATVLEAAPDLVRREACAARLANYWYCAHDPERALPAALEAAGQARRRNAFAEQLRMLERVLDLWDQVAEEVRAAPVRPADRAETYPSCGCPGDAHDPSCSGLQLVDVLAEAVVAARNSGDWDRALALVRRALELVDEEQHPMRAAWFRVQLAKTCGYLNRPGGGETAYAYRLVAGLGPSPVQAEVLAMDAAQGMLCNPTPAHMEVAERAARIAREVGAGAVEQHARITLAGLYSDFGDTDGALALLADAIERTRTIGAADVLCRGLNNLGCLLQLTGRSEEAVERCREGLQVARSTGLLGTIGACLIGNLVEALIAVGRHAEAAETLSDWDNGPSRGSFPEYLDRLRGELDLLDGDFEQATAHNERARAADLAQQPQNVLPAASLALRIAARQGRPLAARAELLAVLDLELSAGFEGLMLPLLVHGAAAEADSRGLPAADLGRPVILQRIAATAARLRPELPLHRGWARLLDGELARADGAADPAPHWAAAIDQLRPLGLPEPLALALLRAADGAAAAGRRDEAATLLREAEPLAARYGDRQLRREIAHLAERAGLALDSAPGGLAAEAAEPVPAVEAFGLTPRETDVLRLLALGRTNRQIAEELYISPKTASVHVSNILAKLAVGGRGEAAALAHRLRLFPEEEPAAAGG
ncbi:helix-turn-helix transcriptional regulator [Kitasatospora paracochleata]|uniref:DNA-binding CsgD family transcriptional regulator/tetratricopeptide (TPR) repeat protein n=1 Tax=Kitasatospora paracochleata TaxID=58354 RepID=A0ABT1IRE1_9ACTN|nr:helix-turn-helix transcriptional regulator [Kitasatospora paracochleata]MCP2307690.1 DNA-binding CsgD family transcriptional regulator/tetratricopeptide (TPR) repeat protein [Kitasatospora paracochleata]